MFSNTAISPFYNVFTDVLAPPPIWQTAGVDITLYWLDGELFFSERNTYIDGGVYEL